MTICPPGRCNKLRGSLTLGGVESKELQRRAGPFLKGEITNTADMSQLPDRQRSWWRSGKACGSTCGSKEPSEVVPKCP